MTLIQPQQLEDLYDSKIEAHFVEIRLLREQRNADCSKTRKLPLEVLSTIFGALNCRRTRSYGLEWIAVTHVCRVWRNTALGDPTLWVDFTDVPRKWIPEYFARSKAAPLPVRLLHTFSCEPLDELDSVFDHVVEHPERIKQLEIAAGGTFVGRLTKPAPLLESLVTSVQVNFPPNFLGGVAPRLKSVTCCGRLPPEASWLANLTKLECGEVHLEATYMSNLTSLKLDWGWGGLDATGERSQDISMTSLLLALEKMTMLQRLDLYFPNDIDTAAFPRPTPVYLHHLRSLTVHFNQVAIASIFNHLRADAIEQLDASWSQTISSTPAAIEPVCQFFESCYRGNDLQSLVQNFGRLEMHQSPTAEGIPSLTLRGYKPANFASFKSLVPRCTPRLLVARLDSSQSPIFPECNTIEELRISARFSKPILFGLPEIDVSPEPFCPSLRRLYLTNISFVPKARRVPQLKRWISKRKSTSKIELLVLKDCPWSKKDIESLRKVIDVRIL